MDYFSNRIVDYFLNAIYMSMFIPFWNNATKIRKKYQKNKREEKILANYGGESEKLEEKGGFRAMRRREFGKYGKSNGA